MSSVFGFLTQDEEDSIRRKKKARDLAVSEEISIQMPTTSTCYRCKTKAEYLLQQIDREFFCEKCCLRKWLEAYVRNETPALSGPHGR